MCNHYHSISIVSEQRPHLSGDTLRLTAESLILCNPAHQSRLDQSRLFGHTSSRSSVPEHCFNTANNMDVEKKASEPRGAVPTKAAGGASHGSSLGSQSKATACDGSGSGPKKMVNPWYVDLSRCKACGECRCGTSSGGASVYRSGHMRPIACEPLGL